MKKPYGKMREGCIYLRNGDKNTPDNGNADVEDIDEGIDELIDEGKKINKVTLNEFFKNES